MLFSCILRDEGSKSFEVRCCFASVGACGVAMLTFSILEASGNVRIDTSWFVLLLVWFLLRTRLSAKVYTYVTSNM